MQRTTHLAVATASVMPLALERSVPAAAGIVLIGMAGAVLPDYLDLRSDARGVLRHRGASHSLAVAAATVLVTWLILQSLAQVEDPRVTLDSLLIRPLTLAFLVGVMSHLVLDACTPRGIQPFLPFLRRRFWLLPRPLRIGTGSRLDAAVGMVALGLIAASFTLTMLERWPQ
ncbi:MAG: metal-dependent hydrolase [Thermomicrobiales bacterium]